MNDASGIHLGTSDFTATGWVGSFYPVGMKPSDFLALARGYHLPFTVKAADADGKIC